MKDPFEQYAKIAPYVIVGALTLGYLLGGGLWWGIPVVILVGVVYALIRVRIGRRLKAYADQKFKKTNS
jgi:hypothetical protein